MQRLVFILWVLFFASSCLPGLNRFFLDFARWNFFAELLQPPPSIGGNVTGLLGTGLRLHLEISQNGSLQTEELPIASNGRFQFARKPQEGSIYSIQILSQPTQPSQFCEVGGGTGTMGRVAVRNVLVQCADSQSLPLPVFTPPPGEFPHPITVSISTPVPSGRIFYTTDGTSPTCHPDGSGTGVEFVSPISIPQPSLPGMEIRAIVCSEDRSSFVQTGLYRITNGQLGTVTSSLPTNPPAPNYTTNPQYATLSPPPSPPPGTTIHYTTDGSTPTCASPSTPNPVGMLYSTTIRAIACAPDWTASPVADFPYIITGTVDTPSFSVAGGNYNDSQTLSLSVITPGASIRYALTTDGTPPVATCSSTLYTSPLVLSASNTKIQAIGCLTGWTDSLPSPIQTYDFTVANPSLTPVPPLGVPSTQVVTASSPTTSATFHFTTDGSNPDCTSSTTPPTIIGDNSETDVTVKVIACRTGFFPSSIASGVYTKTGTLAPPTFSPPANTYTTAQTVAINPGAGNPSGTSIHFRTDGTPATCSDATYATPISVSVSQTLTAISCKSTPLWNSSISDSASYTITGTLATPTFTPPDATYNDIQSVNISSNAGSTIYYEVSVGSDPSNPSCGSGLTSLPVSVTHHDTRIKAIACLTGWSDSAIGTATYVLRPDTPTPNHPGGTVFGNLATISFTSSTGVTFRMAEGSLFSPPANPVCTDPDSGTNFLTIPAYPSGGALRTVKAIACRTNFAPSLLFNQNYTVNGPVTAPTLSTTLDAANRVTAIPNTPPSMQALCYRLGADPECSATLGGSPDPLGQTCASGSTVYNSAAKPILTTTTDFRIRACSNNHEQSSVVSHTFPFTGTVGAVVASPVPSTVENDPTISLSSVDSTVIYYRTDGVNPDCTGVGATTYSTPFVLSPTSPGTATIKAIGCAPSKVPSAVADFTYTFQAATPTTASTAGTKANDESVTLNTTTTGAGIRYTLNGTAPSCASTLYTAAINLPSAAMSATPELRAISCKTNYLDSAVLSRDYTFQTQPPIVKDNATNTVIAATDTTTVPLMLRFESTTTGGRICLGVNHTTDPSPTCDGTSGNCGTGTVNLGLDSGTYFYNSVTTLRTSGAVCKQYYLANSSFTLRRFFVPSTAYLRMFASTGTVQGSFLGATGPVAADDFCNADAGRPSSNVPYLGLIGVGGTNPRSMTVGNPFIPSMEYRRNDRTTSILTTDASAYPPTSLTNAIASPGGSVFTGFDPGPAFTVATSRCSEWTVNDTTLGAGGVSYSSTSTWINFGSSLCSNFRPIYCIESRYRIWITATIYNGNLGGITGADAKCNNIADANHPRSGRYKAMILIGGRVPGGGDWVFKPNAAYYRPDRTTLIAMTDGNAKFIKTDFSTGVENTYQTTTGNFWSGGEINSNFAGTSTDTCSNFSSTTGNGTVGLANSAVLYNYVTNLSTACTTANRILCVEQ